MAASHCASLGASHYCDCHIAVVCCVRMLLGMLWQDGWLKAKQLFAFLDDVCAVCSSDRVGDVHQVWSEELWAHSRIRPHHCKMQVWNRSGVWPLACEVLEVAAQRVNKQARVWKEDTAFPRDVQGITSRQSGVCRFNFEESPQRATRWAAHPHWSKTFRAHGCCHRSALSPDPHSSRGADLSCVRSLLDTMTPEFGSACVRS